MSILDPKKSLVVKEIDSWRAFGEALRAEDRELYRKMMQQVAECYLPAMEMRADPFPNDSLFMGLLFLQHRMIEQLAARVQTLEREKKKQQQENG